MVKVRHSASAEDDLPEARLYVAEDGADAGDRLLDPTDSKTRTLLIGLDGKTSVFARH